MSSDDDGCGIGCLLIIAISALLWAVLAVAFGLVVGWSTVVMP